MHRRRAAWILAIASLFSVQSTTSAQPQATPRVGGLVRVTAPQLGEAWHVGMFNRSRVEPPCYVVLFFSDDGNYRLRRTLSLGEIDQLQVHSLYDNQFPLHDVWEPVSGADYWVDTPLDSLQALNASRCNEVGAEGSLELTSPSPDQGPGVLGQAATCDAPSGFTQLFLSATLEAGHSLEQPFDDRFQLVLEPVEHGWVVAIRERGRAENLARLTPPWHFVPNPRYVEGWHFRNSSNTGPNDGSVNAPQRIRDFIFSPEVGRSLDYEGSATPEATVDRVRSFGRGRLTLTDWRLTPFIEGERASFEELSLQICLVWRTQGGW